LGEVPHQLRQHLEPSQESVKGILIDRVGAGEKLVEQLILPLGVANEERLGELALVLEMIEESALGNTDDGDQFLDLAAKPLSSTADSAASRMRSRVSPPFFCCASCTLAAPPEATVPRVH
jgi:hypothetical protein